MLNAPSRELEPSPEAWKSFKDKRIFMILMVNKKVLFATGLRRTKSKI